MNRLTLPMPKPKFSSKVIPIGAKFFTIVNYDEMIILKGFCYKDETYLLSIKEIAAKVAHC